MKGERTGRTTEAQICWETEMAFCRSEPVHTASMHVVVPPTKEDELHRQVRSDGPLQLSRFAFAMQTWEHAVWGRGGQSAS